MPMAKTASSSCFSTPLIWMESVSFRLFFRTKHTRMISVTRFPRTVAIAAPPAPIPSPKIKTGSRMIFTTEPTTVPIMASTASPSVLIKLPGVRDRITAGAPSAI